MKAIFNRLFHRGERTSSYVEGWGDGYGVGKEDVRKPYAIDPLALVKYMNTQKAKELHGPKI